MADWLPEELILHDYGQLPKGWKPGDKLNFIPYHAVVDDGGNVHYRYPDDPYSRSAAHSYLDNKHSVGLSWAGPVGGTPSEKAMAAIRAERERILKEKPSITKTWSHGEAYEATKGTSRQASRDGRPLIEASWRKQLLDAGYTPEQAQRVIDTAGIQGAPGTMSGPSVDRTPTPIAQRGIAYGHPASAAQDEIKLASGPTPAVRPPLTGSQGGFSSTPAPIHQAGYGRVTDTPSVAVAAAKPEPKGAFSSLFGDNPMKSIGGIAGAFASMGQQDEDVGAQLQKQQAELEKQNMAGLNEAEQAQAAAFKKMMEYNKRYRRA